jgi:DNA polymerase-3 subunit epsilon
MPRMFAAIDFETASISRTSACALGVVIATNTNIVEKKSFLIRPPKRQFMFTHIHGIAWHDVSEAPTFADIWPEIRSMLKEVDFLAAHKASFDAGVLRRCCEYAGLRAPSHPFVCTVELARTYLNLYPTSLPVVCETLRIPLNHHDALSDAMACARIVQAVSKAGWRFRES